MSVQKKLNRDGEMIDSLAKLSQLKEQGGEKAGKSSGSSGGLKNTLKRMKPAGKKKRQRNITAPEITVEALQDLRKEEAQKPAKEGGGRGLFRKKSKDGGSPQKKPEPDAVKQSPEQQTTVPIIKEEVVRESLSSVDDMSLSQKSEPRFSEYPATSRDRCSTLPNLSHSKTDSAINYHHDLSQLSLSPSIPEEVFSTQSSFEAVPLEQLAPPSQGLQEADSGGGSRDGTPSESKAPPAEGKEKETEGEEEGEASRDGDRDGDRDGAKDFRMGYPALYENYGDEQHKLNLKHVLKFMEACAETSPVDLSSLQDWDGWTLATKELM